ncbi:unnamed protein product [Phytomonas sp. Hart1]|nr:unnamed protein product [Phytomonas sp. Hart1]|eukprot:CCW69512.1 unnamed protein product [Phytomonas sp. isolate Hart1]
MFGVSAKPLPPRRPTDLPRFDGVAPRVTALTAGAHRGAFVAMVLVVSGVWEFCCGVTDRAVDITGVPEDTEVSRVCEFICYVDPTTAELRYHQHAMLDDEFDFEVYGQLVGLMAKFPQLF